MSEIGDSVGRELNKLIRRLLIAIAVMFVLMVGCFWLADMLRNAEKVAQ